ncbi:DMT family transporter [Roseovarius sp. 2305UL8-3]|uniref:DMT family transporter n=1 Tax=Roseovarius conchicola TaxID=3121636 RepID=UPI0035291842
MAELSNPTILARDPRGVLLVFLAGVVWSTVGLGIRLIDDAQVWQILFYRSISLSAFLYLLIWWRNGRSAFAMIPALGVSGMIGALALVAAYTGGIYAIQTTSVANAMLLFATAPFMAAILGLLVLREGVRWQTWVAIAGACLGIAIMVGGKFGEGAFVGNLAALGSALGFAVFTIALRWGRAGEMLPCIFLSGLFGIVLMAAICLALDLSLILSPRDSGIAFSMGVFQVGLGLVLYTLGSKSVPAAELTLLSLAEVLLAPLWVWLVLGEVPTLLTMIGGAVLLAAVAGNAVSGIKRKAPVTLV